MKVTFLQQPQPLCFVGNGLHTILSVAPFNSQTRAFDIKVIVKLLAYIPYANNTTLELHTQTFMIGNDGLIKFDFANYANAHLKYYMPDLANDDIQVADGQFAKFFIQAQLLTNEVPSGVAEKSIDFIAIKGGLKTEQSVVPFNLFELIPNASYKGLLFHEPTEKFMPNGNRYLYFFLTQEMLGLPPIYLQIDIIGVNGAYVSVYSNTLNTPSIDTGSLLVVNIGTKLIPAISIDDCINYNVYLKDDDGNVLFQIEKIAIQKQNYYRTMEIMYRNSLGSLETTTLLGQIDFETILTKSEGKQLPTQGNNNNFIFPSTDTEINLVESEKYIVSTGFISKAVLSKYRDFLLAPQKFIVENKQLIPIKTNTSTGKFYSNRDSLFALSFEIQKAIDSAFYTPSNFLAGIVQICPALFGLQAVQIAVDSIEVSFIVPAPHNTIELGVFTNNGSVALIPAYYTKSLPNKVILVLPNSPQNIAIEVKARVVCSIANNSYGTYKTVSLNITDKVGIVAVDDVLNLGIPTQLPYSFPTSVLANDYDPSGGVLGVVATSGTSANNGTYSINTLGIVTYTAPSTAYRGLDNFTYTIQSTSGASTSVTCYISVGGNSSNVVYAKVIPTITHRVPPPFNGGEFLYYGHVYIHYYSDAAGTNPISISGLNLTISYDENLNNNITNKTIPGTGISNFIFNGLLKGIALTRIFALTPSNQYIII
jgi:hypothetical protein